MWRTTAVTYWISGAWQTTRRFRPDRRTAAVVVVLSDQRRSRYRPPDQLRVWCPHHGRSVVSTSDVLTGRGSLVLNLLATAP